MDTGSARSAVSESSVPCEVVLVADDFGLDREVNAAILHAWRNGALTGVSLMMGQPGTEEAVELAREHPGLEIGWHLHLNDSRPCTREAWPWGRSPAGAGFAIGLLPSMRRLAREEIRAQWQAFERTGLPCRFVNTHHHLHVHPVVRRELVRVVPRDFPGWLRWGTPRFFGPGPPPLGYRLLERTLQAPARRRFGFRVSTTLWGIDRIFRMDAREVRHARAGLGEGLHEFMFHPRRLADDPDTQSLLDLGPRFAENGARHSRSRPA